MKQFDFFQGLYKSLMYLKSVFLIQSVYKRVVGEQAGLGVSASV